MVIMFRDVDKQIPIINLNIYSVPYLRLKFEQFDQW